MLNIVQCTEQFPLQGIQGSTCPQMSIMLRLRDPGVEGTSYQPWLHIKVTWETWKKYQCQLPPLLSPPHLQLCKFWFHWLRMELWALVVLKISVILMCTQSWEPLFWFHITETGRWLDLSLFVCFACFGFCILHSYFLEKFIFIYSIWHKRHKKMLLDMVCLCVCVRLTWLSLEFRKITCS